MEVLVPILFALLLGLIFAALLSVPFGRRGPGPWAGFLFFFTILFLGILAAGLWVRPVPGVTPVYGVNWLGFLLFSLILFLLLAAAIPPAPPEAMPPPATSTEEAAETVAVTFGCFFWILLVLLMVTIVGGLAWAPA
jgi:NADH:ubiquinone oxidoreductase subunit 6 (subunit J)